MVFKHWTIPCGLILLCLALLLPLGCSNTVQPRPTATASQRVRIRLIENVDHVLISAADDPSATTDGNPSPVSLNFPRNTRIPVMFSPKGWTLGGSGFGGAGVLTLRPGSAGSLRIEDKPYRGIFHFVPTGGGKFDVINDVDVEDYLKGVVCKEMFDKWHVEALEAQAVVARTYALYQSHTVGLDRYWDLYADQRSQVYGGIEGETTKSRQAVEDTFGMVLTNPADGKIFETYFSSCCGGVTQAVNDAFPGSAPIGPLGSHSNDALCNASPYYNWPGPITIKKTEIARRVSGWAQHMAKIEGHPNAEMNIKGVYNMQVQSSTTFGRPRIVAITDSTGAIFTIAAEEMRSAVDYDAGGKNTLPSSYCKINGDPNSDSVTFYEGHGYGHGVGLCQYTAEALASQGYPHDQILLKAFPGAKLLRAY